MTSTFGFVLIYIFVMPGMASSNQPVVIQQLFKSGTECRAAENLLNKDMLALAARRIGVEVLSSNCVPQ